MQKLLIPEHQVCQDQVCLMPRPFFHSPPGRLLALPSSVKPTSKFSKEHSIIQSGCRQLLLLTLTTMLTQSLNTHHAVLVCRWIADDVFGYVLDCSAEQYDSIVLDPIPVGEGYFYLFCATTGGTGGSRIKSQLLDYALFLCRQPRAICSQLMVQVKHQCQQRK